MILMAEQLAPSVGLAAVCRALGVVTLDVGDGTGYYLL